MHREREREREWPRIKAFKEVRTSFKSTRSQFCRFKSVVMYYRLLSRLVRVHLYNKKSYNVNVIAGVRTAWFKL